MEIAWYGVWVFLLWFALIIGLFLHRNLAKGFLLLGAGKGVGGWFLDEPQQREACYLNINVCP